MNSATGDRRDVFANDFQADQQRNGEERSRHAPRPCAKHEGHKDNHPVQKEVLSQRERSDEITFQQMQEQTGTHWQ